jgi:hypothetical protein
LKLSRNKIADVLIEYGSEYAPRAVPINLTKGEGRVKKESVVKRLFEEQPSDVLDNIIRAPQSSSSEPKKARVTSTSQLLDSHYAEVRAQTGGIFDFQYRVHDKWLCKVLKCNDNNPCWFTLESGPHYKLSGADTKL